MRRRDVLADLFGVGVEKDMVRFRGTKGEVAGVGDATAQDMNGELKSGRGGGATRPGWRRRDKGWPSADHKARGKYHHNATPRDVNFLFR